MDIRALVGRNVRRLRQSRGFTQEQLAEAGDVTQQLISDLERGRGNPTVLTLDRLAGPLGVQVADLVSAASPEPVSRRLGSESARPGSDTG